MIKKIKYGLASLTGLWLISMPVLFFAQNWIIFQPKKLALNYKFQFDTPFEERFFQVNGGDSINTIFIKSLQQPSKGVVLYFHGNADNLQRWANYHKDLTSRGYDFFVMDYRGYGKSSGKPSEQFLYEDARFFYDFLRKTYDSTQIVIYGRSLGTGIAAQLASQVSAKCLILETPYNNINCALAKHIFLNQLPYSLDCKLETERFLPIIKCPILAFHGTSDWVIPYACAKKIIPLLRKKDKFITIEGGGHKNLSQYSMFQENLDEILR